MLRVECESCKAPYQVDERRIPATGLKMRCPKCTHTFVVMAGSGEPVPPPDPHARPSPNSPVPAPAAAAAQNRKMQATMLGVGSGISKPPPAKKAEPPPRGDAPRDSEIGLPIAKGLGAKASDDVGLPATREPESASLPAAKKAAPPLPSPRVGPPPAPKVTAPALPRSAAKAPASAEAPVSFGELGLDFPVPKITPVGLALDLPAAKPKDDLPATAKPKADLPAVKANDLPAPKVANDLPAAKPGSQLPAIKKPTELPVRQVKDLPPPKANEADFGEIDLPSLGGDLPAPGAAAGNLPQVAANLPAVAATLPTVADALPAAAVELPSAANALPSPAQSLPTSKKTPAPMAAAVAAQSAAPKPPAPAENEEFISVPPDPMDAPPEEDFGELDLPPAKGDDGKAPAFGDLSFGDLDLPPPPPLEMISVPPAAAPPPRMGSLPPDDGGGLGFGEVELATAPSAEPIETEEAAFGVSGDGADAGEEALPGASSDEQVIPTAAAVAPPKERPQPVKRGPGRKIALGLFALAVAGGGALELTNFGAFGRNVITDTLKAGDYERRVQEVGVASRRGLGSDLYADARSAADRAAAAHQEMPRARALTAYAAIVECEYQLRFGASADRVPRVKQWLAELAATPDTKYLPAALAAQQALGADIDKASKALEAVSKREATDPVQEDIAVLRGELALLASDGKAALEAFNKAQTFSKTARVEFGRARAFAVSRELDAAKKSIEETLKLSPKHADARILRASLAWAQKNEAPALADLAAVLEGEAKDAGSPRANASAHALRGWIHVGRGRSAEARASFEAALKLDSRNVSALVGQGEVLYSDGRYTEALTRFETAVQTDPNSVLAIVSAAKAKLPLERLQDAKTQVAAARAKFPKDWRVAYWLGRAELALGNKAVAEKEFISAVDLVDREDADAVQPYVSLAMLYGGQGKAKEANLRLAEAKSKLPDTATLRRALGDMAAQQGDYDGAVAHFRAALEKDGADLSTRFRLAVTLRRMRKMADASAEFDKIVAVDKDYPGLALERGLLYEESGDMDKALEQFQGALAKAPDDLDLMLRVGATYAAIGRPGDAVPILRKVLEKRGLSAEANHYLGRALFLQPSGPAQVEAMRFLKRAVELDGNRAEYHLYVGWAANNAIPAKLDVARESVEKALAIDKLLADAYWQRGVVGRKQGVLDDAIADLKRAIELKPSRIDAYAALAECYEDKNDTAQAFANWQKAIAADATKPAWRYRFGKLLFERNNMGEASKHLLFAADEGEKAEPRPGWLASAEFLAGEVLKKSGKKAEAIERYKKFMEIAPTNSPERKEATQALTELGVPPKR